MAHATGWLTWGISVSAITGAGGGVGHGLGVVTGGVGGDAAAPLGFAEAGEERQAAAHLERAGRLDVLVLTQTVAPATASRAG